MYAVLPLTRLFTAQAGKTLLTYGLTLWLLCGSVLPVLFTFWPFSLTEGTVREYSMRFTGMAVGLGVLGWLLHTQGKKLPAKCYALLYLGGFALNFFAVVVRGCRRDNQKLETALTQQLAAYDRGAEELTGARDHMRWSGRAAPRRRKRRSRRVSGSQPTAL